MEEVPPQDGLPSIRRTGNPIHAKKSRRCQKSDPLEAPSSISTGTRVSVDGHGTVIAGEAITEIAEAPHEAVTIQRRQAGPVGLLDEDDPSVNDAEPAMEVAEFLSTNACFSHGGGPVHARTVFQKRGGILGNATFVNRG
jgi:hypothetical protein